MTRELESIDGPQMRGPGARSIQNQELVFEQQRPAIMDERTSATWQQEFGDGRNEMNK